MSNLNNNQTQYHQDQQLHKLVEGLEAGDLNRLISQRITVDEYKSKMGDDEDIVVISFQIDGKDPAMDLVNFVEKSYEWVVDADVSSGEITDGKYIVFVETERDSLIAEHIVEMLTDLENITEHKIEDWNIEYFKPKKTLEATVDSLRAIPSSPEEYRRINKIQKDQIDQLKTAAGVNVDTKAPKNDFTESLRTMAGIR